MTVNAASGPTSSPIGAVLNWFARHLRGNEMSQLDPAELEAMAHDLNLSADELVRLAAGAPQDITLLKRMLSLHGLDYDTMIREFGGAVRGMEVTCSRCAERKICQHDLDTGADAATCDAYCPNADEIKSFARGV